MEHKIDLVVFDMDDVLARLDRSRRLKHLSMITGRETHFLQAAIWDSGFESEAERGRFKTGTEYLEEFNRLIGSHVSREQWIEVRRTAMTLDSETLQIAAHIRKRRKIAMLTNNGPLLLDALPELLPDVQRVFGEHAHASFQFHARKPEPQVFEGLLAHYGVSANSAIFIDDCLEFTEGARAVGMIAIHFKGVIALRKSLSELGIDSCE